MGGIGLHVLFFEGIGVNAMGTQSTLGSGAVHKWREVRRDIQLISCLIGSIDRSTTLSEEANNYDNGWDWLQLA